MIRLLVLALIANTASFASATPLPTGSGKNIVQLAQSVPDLSTLVTALTAGELTTTLSSRGPFTVFAPTNEAFAKLPAATLAHLLDPKNIKELQRILEYHVLSGAVFSKDLKTFQMVKTVEGGELKIVKIGSRVIVQNATVTAADNAATNGVVHIIDSVLSPPAPAPSKSIVDLVVADPDLSTLVTALKAADLVNTLSGPGPFNVFTPSNAAFAALPDGVLANLLKPENKAQLVDLLLYHVSKGHVDYPTDRQLSDDPRFPFPKLIETLAAGKNITVQATNHPCGRGGRNKCYNILLETGNTSPKSPRRGVNIADPNVPNTNAANGVLHPVGRVLTPPAPLPNIVQLAQSVPDLSTLVTALVDGKLTDALSGTGPFTVFAPTNEAFAKIPAATLARLLDPANIKELDALLEYHVIAGAAIFAKDLKPTQEVKTLEGEELKVVVNAGRVTVNDNTVTAADNAASNGVVHIIDGVLLPPSSLPNIVQLAQSVPDLSTLVTALVDGKLTDALSGTGPFTVFAPTNEAFAKIPAATLARLLEPANIKKLDALLEYHVIAGAAIFAKDLKPTQEVKTLEGEELKIVVNAGRVTVNKNTVTAADNAASNGVVHIIDGVLLPPSF